MLKPSLRFACERHDEILLRRGGQRQVLLQRLRPALQLRCRLRSQRWLNQRGSYGLDSCRGKRPLRSFSWLHGIQPEALLRTIGQSLHQHLQGGRTLAVNHLQTETAQSVCVLTFQSLPQIQPKLTQTGRWSEEWSGHGISSASGPTTAGWTETIQLTKTSAPADTAQR